MGLLSFRSISISNCLYTSSVEKLFLSQNTLHDSPEGMSDFWAHLWKQIRNRANDDVFGPLGQIESSKHLAEQLILIPATWPLVGQDYGKIHRYAINVPMNHQYQRKEWIEKYLSGFLALTLLRNAMHHRGANRKDH